MGDRASMTEKSDTGNSSAFGGGRLRNVLISASGWSLGGHVLGQSLRFASNLILTRILFPEAFGLMAIVNSFLLALTMLSDIGISQSVIQNVRGEEIRFLDTAWTVQAVRGVALWIIAGSLAYPASALYGESALFHLILVLSLSSLFLGFTSMSIHIWNRRLQQKRVVLLELGSQAIAIACTIGLSFYWRDVMALAVGGVVGAFAKMTASHLWSDLPPHRLAWDREASGSLFRFGRWIFLSSALGFMVSQGDRLILGGFLTMTELGLYAIAAFLSQAVLQINNVLADRVLLALYSRFGKITTPTLVERVAKIRMTLMSAFLPPLCLLVVGGDLLIDLLYDDRYAGAGWILRILSAGTIFTIVGQIGPVYFARGESFIPLIAISIRSAFLLCGMLIGWKIAESTGIIVAIALSHVINFPLQVWISRRYDLWIPRLDLLGLGLSAAFIGGGMLLRAHGIGS